MRKLTVCIFTMSLFLTAWPTLTQAERIFPPWNKPPHGGLHFTVPEIDNVPDLHGDMRDPDLVVFLGGNQFMVLPDIMAAFQKAYPAYKRIYYQTLPPGILAQQLKKGSLVIGNLKITIKPDVFVAGEKRMKNLKEEGKIASYEPYFSNKLAIMVSKGNPRKITSLSDLGSPDIRVSMPNPEIEGIGGRIVESYRKAGGESLVSKIMKEKVKQGTTFMTQIHHRQTPVRIMLGKSDAGPVWETEARFQQRIGNPIDLVEIPEKLNTTGITAAGKIRNAEHEKAAEDFIEFLKSPKAQSIYREYGFGAIEHLPGARSPD